MNILTIIVLLYLALAMARAFYFGFIKTLFSMFFLVLVVATTSFLATPVSNALKGSENVSNYVKEQSEKLIENGADNAIGRLSEASGSDELSLAIMGSALQLNGVKKIAAERLSEVVMKAMGVAGAAVISFLFWVVVEGIMLYMTKNSFIGPINRIFGLLLGTFKGLLVVWIAFGIISALQFTSAGGALMNQILESPVLTEINRWNFLMRYIPDVLLSFII